MIQALFNLSVVMLLCNFVAAALADNVYVRVPAAALQSTLSKQRTVSVPGFQLQKHPVTNAEFLAFISIQKQWRRDEVPVVLVGADYLSHWQAADELGSQALPQQPVTRVSWFAASAYCAAQHARLPTWYEWELAAAADSTRRDARSDPEWRQRILDWYARPASDPPPDVERDQANVYGLHNMNGLIWEWVEDFNSLVIGGTGTEKFCGSGAASLEQKENYAVLMRIAMLSSLRAVDTGHALGFRCARSLESTQ